MRNALIAAVVLILIGITGWYMYPRTAAPAPQQQTQGQTQQNAGIANPASVNCVQTLGGRLEIVDGAGGAVGYCHLPDGRVCEEWGLFRDNTCKTE